MQNSEFWNNCHDELEQMKKRKEAGIADPELVEPENGVVEDYFKLEPCVA